MDSFLDLGMMPSANAYLTREQLQENEAFFPLHAWVCRNCLLVQIQDVQKPEELFLDYSYLSSASNSWLEHAKNFVEESALRLSLNAQSQVVEIACNDGYLLQYFVEKGIPVLGVEPAKNLAPLCQAKKIPVVSEFFSASLAGDLEDQGRSADLIVANNVLAHVPDLNDFIRGLKRLLKPNGTLTLEFPSLLNLIRFNQFDTIYHEHFSYFSLHVAQRILSSHGFRIHEVRQLPTHGGSFRLYCGHAGEKMQGLAAEVIRILEEEEKAGLKEISTYLGFSQRVHRVKSQILEFFHRAKREGKIVGGYGAPAKGNIILNYCGISPDSLSFTVDKNPLKEGKFLPGTHIPIFSPEEIFERRPSYLFILPWNLKNEIMEQMKGIREWGGKFIVPIPHLEELS